MRATAASRHDTHPLLTESDMVLLERLSYGVTDEMIGWERRVSVETVRESIDSVVSALGAKNREHAVAIALKTGLIR
jgi:DNA-binding NarL/FixJ family response regulator